MSSSEQDPLLEVRELSAGFETDTGFLEAVDRVSFSVGAGKTLGIVGESGCGKSVTAHCILRLLPQPAGKITGGQILFQGQDLVALSENEIRRVRGKSIGMIFQEPMAALNPVQPVGKQITESIILHDKVSPPDALRRAIEMLALVGIPHPQERISDYPHQLSGGMRQRVMIAMALVGNPKLLIADEPTTALDVTTQAQILELIERLKRELGMSIILITHDLGVIAEHCEEVVVMYAGRVVEKTSAQTLFAGPRHRYTAGLLDAIPNLETVPKSRLKTIRGTVPGLAELPVGARFAPRCDHPEITDYLASSDFLASRPGIVEAAPGHWVEDCPYVRTDG